MRRTKIALGAALLVALVASAVHFEVRESVPRLSTAFAPDAYAQSFSVDKSGTGRVGYTMPCFNTLDSTILSGTLLQLDTTTTVKRFGVTPYTGTLSDRKRICGVAAGNIPKRTLGGAGAMLVWGFVPDLKVSNSTIAAGAPVRVGTLHGAVKDAGDSLSMEIGYLLRGTDGTLRSGRYSAPAWIWPINHAVTGSL